MQQPVEIAKEYLSLLVASPTAGALGATLLSIVNFMYGTGITLTVTAIFVAVLVLDWISGRAASKKDGSYASEYGINGAYRTAFILILLSLAYRTDVALIGAVNIDSIYPVYPIFFYLIVNFGLPMWRSMTANVYRAGWDVWIPQKVLTRIADEIEHKTARAKKRVAEKNQYLGKEGDSE